MPRSNPLRLTIAETCFVFATLMSSEWGSLNSAIIALLDGEAGDATLRTRPHVRAGPPAVVVRLTAQPLGLSWYHV